MDRLAEDLKARTKKFLHKVLDLLDTLPKSTGAQVVAGQLARAGCGVAGNYRAACRSRSHAEFTARMGVVLEESDESELWISVADDRQWGDGPLRAWLVDEAMQLRSIFAKAYETAREREKHRKESS